MLIVVTAAGVQRFIGEARTTADLRNGSVLISAAMGRVRDVISRGGGEVILPAARLQRQGDDAGGLPNRVVALFDGDGGALAAEAVSAASKWWASEAARVVGADVAALVPGPAFSWVVVDGDEYATIWALSHRALAARKRVRTFAPCYMEATRLCACSGRYPALSEPPKNGQLRVPAARRREHLSAEAWFKRGFRPGGFPSTRTVASVWYRHAVIFRIADDESVATAASALNLAVARLAYRGHSGYPVLDEWAEAAGPAAEAFHGYDGQWCAGDAWDAERLTRDGQASEADAVSMAEQGREAAARLRTAMGTNVAGPGGDLALVVQDLDLLGWTLSQRPDQGFHRAMAQAIADCARVQTLDIESEETLGRVVYAGGDDLVALVPAETALVCAGRVRQAVEERIGVVAPGVTASTAVVFFPADYPLQSAMGRARGALHQAKENGRDSLAVVVLQSGGVRDAMVTRWFEGSVIATERLRRLAACGLGGARLSSRLHGLRRSITNQGVLDRELERQLSRSETLGEGRAQAAEDLAVLCVSDQPAKRLDQLEAVTHLASALQALHCR